MLTVIFSLTMIWVVWKMFVWGVKAAWGISKFICTVILLPLFLIGLVVVGLIYVAIPVLAVVGAVVIIRGLTKE